MAGRTPYPQEMKERAVRMVREVRENYGNEYAAIKAVAARLGVGSPETVRKWLRRAQVDAGERPGLTTEEKAEIKALKQEVAELRQVRSSRRPRLFSRPSSTGHRAARDVHQQVQGRVRGRAGLPCADRGRLADRPGHLLCGREAAAAWPRDAQVRAEITRMRAEYIEEPAAVAVLAALLRDARPPPRNETGRRTARPAA